MLRLGRYSLTAVPTGSFGLDGGAMFGIIPRPLWQRVSPPDDANRIALGMRLLLIEGPERTWLVDTGIGDKFDARHKQIYAVADEMLPDDALRAAGKDPDRVTDVILTHLHFDHAGGATRADGEPVFPNARYHVQRAQLDWARRPSLKDRGSFRPLDFAPLADADRLVFHEGRTEIADDLELIPVDGHTPAMQLVKVEGDGQTLLYGADLVPTVGHVRTPYVMAYDVEPLKTVAEKTEWLGRAADEDWILFFEHDPACAARRIRRTDKDFEAGEEVSI